MAITLTFSIDDGITPATRAMQNAFQPENLFPIIGRSAVNTVRDYLFDQNASRANKLGGSRTNFYASAARATHFDEVDDGVLISINQVGIAQRYYGGTIEPVSKKFLTIPARAEAYGKRAGEFPNLVVLWSRNGPYALAAGEQSSSTVSSGSGKNSRARTSRQNAVKPGIILFWLVKSVTQKPDPTVLPDRSTIIENIKGDVNSYLTRSLRRGGAN